MKNYKEQRNDVLVKGTLGLGYKCIMYINKSNNFSSEYTK